MGELTELYMLVKAFISASDKNEAFNAFFNKFEPLLMKYAHKLNDVDAKFDLGFALYKALLKMPIETERFQEDKYILSYIDTSIRREFIKLMSEKNSWGSEFSLDSDTLPAIASTDDDFSEMWHGLLADEIKRVLSSDEFDTVRALYQGYNESDIAQHRAVTRQAVYKQVKRIRKKAKKAIT